MGTTFELYSLGDCKTKDSRSIAVSVKGILERYETSLSLYQTESELSRLNKDGFLKSPSPYFLEALDLGLRHAKQTQGAFDPSVRRGYRLIEQRIRESGKPPTDSEIAKLIPLTNYRLIVRTAQQVEFRKKGMEITLDGNVKGLAVDRVSDYLKQAGIHNFVANFSGNMRIEGRSLGGKPWNITVEHPMNRDSILIPFQFQAISTSAPTYNHFTPDKSWHHLLNPRTLKPAQGFASATVFGPLAETCDALSTAVFVMDVTLARTLFKTHYPDYRYWLFLRDGTKVEGP